MMRQVRYPVLLAALAFVTIGLQACAFAGPTVPEEDVPRGAYQSENVRVTVTTGFGADQVLDMVVDLSPGASAMDALKQAADVETTYGGGFVQDINGVRSGSTGDRRHDWFYSINGITAKTGADGYLLHDGDIEHWDYRDWSFRKNVSATLGVFPAAFVHGYAGETMGAAVVYEEGLDSEAGDIVLTLESAGVSQVLSLPLANTSDEILANNNVVILAGATAGPVAEVNENWQRLGLFAHFDGQTLETFSAAGQPSATFDHGAGVLLSMQNPWNPGGTGACRSVALIATGCDSAGIRASAAALVAEHDQLACLAGAVVYEDTVRPLPSRT